MGRKGQVRRGSGKPSGRSFGVPTDLGNPGLTAAETALCEIVVTVLMDRHRERKRASVDMSGHSVRKAGKSA